jgi:hypothetical protein
VQPICCFFIAIWGTQSGSLAGKRFKRVVFNLMQRIKGFLVRGSVVCINASCKLILKEGSSFKPQLTTETQFYERYLENRLRCVIVMCYRSLQERI